MCPAESQLRALLTGELPRADAATVRDHLAACDPCRRRFADLQSLWTTLGHWQPPLPNRDLSAQILAAARADHASHAAQATAPFRPWRLAAGVLLAICTGVALGSLVHLPTHPLAAAPASPIAPASPDDVMQSLGLDALSADPPGLAGNLPHPDALTPDQPSNSQEHS